VSGKGKGKGKGKERVATVGKGLSGPPPKSLCPHGDRDQRGPIGVDGKRPIFKFIEHEARERAAAASSRGKGAGECADKLDADGFRVVARAAGVWPRVGGTDVGGRRNDTAAMATTGKAEPKGGRNDGDCDGDIAKGKGPSAQTTGPRGRDGKGCAMPARPPWADCEDDDDDGAGDADDPYREPPEDEDGRMHDDDDMGEGDGYDEGDGNYYYDDEPPPRAG
jgi:hypothetical protein